MIKKLERMSVCGLREVKIMKHNEDDTYLKKKKLHHDDDDDDEEEEEEVVVVVEKRTGPSKICTTFRNW